MITPVKIELNRDPEVFEIDLDCLSIIILNIAEIMRVQVVDICKQAIHSNSESQRLRSLRSIWAGFRSLRSVWAGFRSLRSIWAGLQVQVRLLIS